MAKKTSNIKNNNLSNKKEAKNSKIATSKTKAVAPKKAVTKKVVAKAVAPKKAAAKKVVAKVIAPKKAAAKKVVAKAVAPKKAAAKKVVAKAVAPKKAVAKKVVTKTVVPKKAAAKKVVTKTVAPKKAAVKKVVAKTVAPKKAEINKTTATNSKNTKKNQPTKLSAIEISKTKLHVGTQHLPSYTNEAYVHKDLKPLTKEQKSIVRYSDKDLAEFRDLIHAKLKKAKEEVDYYSDQIKNFSESDTKFSSMDDGSYTSERESVNQIIGRQQKLIVHLENALARIENKTYGICRETGLLIPKERLRAVPHATLSVEGKKKQK
jgi:RNA polymerase-binding protein DksA